MPHFRTLLIALMLLWPSLLLAATDAGDLSAEPVKVSADRLEANELTNSLVFIGHAEARQGDVTIHADRLIVHSAGQSRKIERVEAEGNVRIVQGARVATGQQATFYRAEGRIVLRGEPRVSEAENFVQGHEITLFLNERRSVVTGGESSRVNAVFQPAKGARP